MDTAIARNGARRNVKRKRDSRLELEVNVKRTQRCRQKEHDDNIHVWYKSDGKICYIWDPWMMDSKKTTCSVLWKRLIPTVLINMIQEFTHDCLHVYTRSLHKRLT